MTPTRDQLALLAKIRHLASTGGARKRRIAARVRLVELAAVLEISPATLSRWEHGRRSPSTGAALAWLAALELLARSEAGGGDAA